MTLPGTYWIYGYVTDERGAINGATVSISGDSCETDANGYYQLNAIGENDNSRVTISASYSGTTITSYPYLDTNNLTTQQNFHFASVGFVGNFYAYGNVTNDGTPVENAEVVFSDSTTSNSILTTTDASGYYQVNLNTITNDGDVVLASASSGTNYVTDSFTLDLQNLTENVDFDFSTGTTLSYDTSDTVPLTDSSQATLGWFPYENVPVSDDTPIFETTNPIAENVPVIDAAIFQSSTSTSDIVDVQDSIAVAWAEFASDTVGVSDSVPTFTDNVFPSDTLSIIESTVFESQVPINDVVPIDDLTELTQIVPASDTVPVSDTVSWVWKYTPRDTVSIYDYNSVPISGEASMVSLRTGCNTVNLLVEWAGYSGGINKGIRTINFWDKSDIAVLDSGLNDRAIIFKGVIAKSFELGMPPYMVVNTINALANQGMEIEMELIQGHESSGVYIIKSFFYKNKKRTVDTYEYTLELEFVRDTE